MPGSEERAQRHARGINWDTYKPGVSIGIRQSKTGKRLTIPLFDRMPNGEVLLLYPELEEQLARICPPVPATGPIILEERTGKPYKHRRMSTVHRQICDGAKLPKNMTFTGFRHGGATEIGDSGETDIQLARYRLAGRLSAKPMGGVTRMIYVYNPAEVAAFRRG